MSSSFFYNHIRNYFTSSYEPVSGNIVKHTGTHFGFVCPYPGCGGQSGDRKVLGTRTDTCSVPASS